MPQLAPLSLSFKGLNKRVAAHALAEGESPDCENAWFHTGELQALGPRKGCTKVSSSAYSAGIVGLGLYEKPNGLRELLVATDDGSSVVVVPENAPWNPGGSGWAGPTARSAGGKVVSWALTPWSGPLASGASSPATTKTFAAAISMAEMIRVIGNALSGSCSKGSFTVQLSAWIDGLEYTLCSCAVVVTCGAASLTSVNSIVNCSGKVNLTALSAKITNNSGETADCTLSGTVDVAIVGEDGGEPA